MRDLKPSPFAEDIAETVYWKDPRWDTGELKAEVMTRDEDGATVGRYLVLAPPDVYYAMCFGDREEFDRYRAWLDAAADLAWPAAAPCHNAEASDAVQVAAREDE